ncbi:uncharacterized protein LOC119718767 [Patiria miniata]|uniref:Uncharacterized protein n=1 Tax=Patiria miniata TaxID=46514 RepID=A0A913Z0B3_PATMI|nr:uncharacterized protein LOC119718767 [Patiria miniata]
MRKGNDKGAVTAAAKPGKPIVARNPAPARSTARPRPTNTSTAKRGVTSASDGPKKMDASTTILRLQQEKRDLLQTNIDLQSQLSDSRDEVAKAKLHIDRIQKELDVHEKKMEKITEKITRYMSLVTSQDLKLLKKERHLKESKVGCREG